MDYLQTQDVRFSYDEDESGIVEVLKGVTLGIQKGDFVSLLGHNGSGKSTLAKHFNAILLPSGGKVYVDTMDTTDDSLKFEIRKRVGLILQNPDNQLVASIVEEDIAFGPENLGVPPAEIRQRVDDALKAVDSIVNMRRTNYQADKNKGLPLQVSLQWNLPPLFWTSLLLCLTREVAKKLWIP